MSYLFWSPLFKLVAIWRVSGHASNFAEDRFGTHREIPKFDALVQSWDCAFKTGHANDFSACVTIGRVDWSEGGSTTAPGYHLVHAWRGRVALFTVFADYQPIPPKLQHILEIRGIILGKGRGDGQGSRGLGEDMPPAINSSAV